MLELIVLAILAISFFLHPLLFIAEIFLLLIFFMGYAFWRKRQGMMPNIGEKDAKDGVKEKHNDEE